MSGGDSGLGIPRFVFGIDSLLAYISQCIVCAYPAPSILHAKYLLEHRCVSTYEHRRTLGGYSPHFWADTTLASQPPSVSASASETARRKNDASTSSRQE